MDFDDFFFFFFFFFLQIDRPTLLQKEVSIFGKLLDSLKFVNELG